MITNRRNFLKSAGMLTAAAALFNPASLFAQKSSGKSGSSKVMKLEFEPYELQFKHAFAISTLTRTTTPIVLTKITYDGYTGYGEAAMPPYLGETAASVNGFLQRVRKEVLPGFNDPFRIQEIMEETDRLAAGNTAAKASVDIALHDLTGKIMGQPWWKIWGFSPEKTPYTSFTIGYDDDDDTVRAKTGEASWTKVLKVKLGMGDEKDRRMVRLVREVNGTAPLYVDANQGWTDRERALDMIYWLKGQGAVLVEQPMSKYDLDSHAWLTERSPLPIIADEACQRLTDIPRLKGAFHGINIKLMKCTEDPEREDNTG